MSLAATVSFMEQLMRSDGDQEELDLEEYNFAYALWLQQEGWDVDEDDRVEESGSGSGSGSEADYCDEVPLVEEVKLIKKSSAARRTKAKLEDLINGTSIKLIANGN